MHSGEVRLRVDLVFGLGVVKRYVSGWRSENVLEKARVIALRHV